MDEKTQPGAQPMSETVNVRLEATDAALESAALDYAYLLGFANAFQWITCFLIVSIIAYFVFTWNKTAG
jgi:hypothetical protein